MCEERNYDMTTQHRKPENNSCQEMKLVAAPYDTRARHFTESHYVRARVPISRTRPLASKIAETVKTTRKNRRFRSWICGCSPLYEARSSARSAFTPREPTRVSTDYGNRPTCAALLDIHTAATQIRCTVKVHCFSAT